jgi:simple sugar transport system ATP-binding protein
VKDVSFTAKKGEIVCIAGIDGNGQTELVHAITGLDSVSEGSILLNGQDVTKKSVRFKNTHGLSHIPEDRHKHGLVLDYNLAYNLVLQQYF